jgi:hypothetical protein
MYSIFELNKAWNVSNNLSMTVLDFYAIKIL